MYRKDNGLLDKNETNGDMNGALAQLIPVTEYRYHVVEDFNDYIIGVILHVECINCYFNQLTGNPVLATYTHTATLPPCQDVCDFCH